MTPPLPDRIAEPLPSAFGARILAEDLLLAGIEDNPVYEAFRRRRVAHRRSSLRFRWPAVPGADVRDKPTGLESWRILFSGLWWVLLSLGTAWPAFTVASGHINRRGHASGRRLPQAAHEACSIFGGHRTALTDLYLCGCTGSQIVAAIYAEYLEYLRFWRLFIVGLMLGLLMLLVVGHVYGEVVPAYILTALIVFALGLSVYRRLPVELLRLAVMHHVEPLVIHWGAESSHQAMMRHLERVYRRQVKLIAVILLCLFAVGLFLFSVAPWLGQLLQSGGPWLGMVPIAWFLLGTAFLSLTVWGSMGNSARRYWTPIAEEYLREADAAFDHYMREVVLKD